MGSHYWQPFSNLVSPKVSKQPQEQPLSLKESKLVKNFSEGINIRYSWLLRFLIYVLKSQLISECLFCAFNFPKNQRKI